jgi:phage tail tape-measure protein
MAGKASGAAGLALIPVMGAMTAWDIAQDESLTEEEKFAAQARNAGSALGGLGGAMAGAALGTAIFPGIGTVVGGLLGSFLGDWLGSAAVEEALAQRQGVMELHIENNLTLDGEIIATDVQRRVYEQDLRYGMAG